MTFVSHTARRTYSRSGRSLLPAAAFRLIEANREKPRRFNKTAPGFRGNLLETTRYLLWKGSCHTLSEASGYIAGEIERERLYWLYRKIFPREWKKSAASFTKNGNNEYHTARETEFLNLVSDKYFPLGTFLDWEDYRFDAIPIEPLNIDLCCGEFDWEDFRPCLRFGVAAFLYRGGGLYDTDWNEILASFNLQPEDLPPISHAQPSYGELDRQRDNPQVLRFIHLIEFIHHDTGNPFIDATCCSPMESYAWTHDNLENLKAEYQAVSRYFDSMDRLDEDIERNPLKTFRELISLWNTGRLSTEKRTKAADKINEQSGLLINILAPLNAPEEAELNL